MNTIQVTTVRGEAGNLLEAHRQWASRPSDERFLSLDDLESAVALRKQESIAYENVEPEKVSVYPSGDGGIMLDDGVRAKFANLNNWSFGQLCTRVRAPGGYLRRLPASLAVENLNYGFRNNLDEDGRKPMLMLTRPQAGDLDQIRSFTSMSYGRIWDLDVVRAVREVSSGNGWKVPSASYSADDPKRATTLYAGDRDVFIFLVDETHPVEVGNETLSRGFYVWNSEVGSKIFGISMFLYRYVCDNRIIWGSRDVRTLKIRHMQGAPEKFLTEGRKVLREYANSSTADVTTTIRSAMQLEVGKTAQAAENWLYGNQFSRAEARRIIAKANEEEGQSATVWNLVQGATALARDIQFSDARVDLERRAGLLMRDLE